MIKLVDSSSSNPLPQDAEHSPAPEIPSSASESNPLPDHAEHTPAVIPVDASNVNPIGQSAQPSKASSASNDALIHAISYLIPLVGIINLIGQNTRAKFHGAQSLAYWFIWGLAYWPIIIVSTMLGVLGGAIGGIIGVVLLFILYLGIGLVALPWYLAYTTFKGKDVKLPLIGKFIAEKMGYDA
ncbi:hypothetical protein HY994_02365 [Candidatus Micrarchaeota archaeon]|nr:hypothetical protein [Candidatus Micrarchaeota archaeon]